MLLDDYGTSKSKGAFTSTNLGLKNNGWIKESILETKNDNFIQNDIQYLNYDSEQVLINAINANLGLITDELLTDLINEIDLTELSHENIDNYIELIYSNYLSQINV